MVDKNDEVLNTVETYFVVVVTQAELTMVTKNVS